MIATIDRAVGAGIYLVRDQAGRGHRVMATAEWRRGEVVLVVDGWIVGPAAVPPPAAVYEV